MATTTTTTTTTTTRLADEFKGSQRYRSIVAVFEAIDAGAPKDQVLSQASRLGQTLTGDERGKLPDLINQALKQRGRAPGS